MTTKYVTQEDVDKLLKKKKDNEPRLVQLIFESLVVVLLRLTLFMLLVWAFLWSTNAVIKFLT